MATSDYEAHRRTGEIEDVEGKLGSQLDASSKQENTPTKFYLLNIPISITKMEDVVGNVVYWASQNQTRLVFVRDVASLMAARSEPFLAALHEIADLIVPDGMPLVWAGRIHGYGKDIGRVAGADLLDAVCKRSIQTGQSHYFYGGKPGVAEKMIANLSVRYPGLVIAGYASPPMRNIGPSFKIVDEAINEVEMIKLANPDYIWIGISSPKQEYWMYEAAPLVGKGVFFGVGAAFDFHSGTIRRAPKWMQRTGLEWLHRLLSEPRRLWRRYLLLAPEFVFRFAIEYFLKVSFTRK